MEEKFDKVMSKIKINCKAPQGKWTQMKVNKRHQSNTGKNAKRIQMTQSAKWIREEVAEVEDQP